MELSATGCLSERQNELFDQVVDWLCGRYGLVRRSSEVADLVYMCGLPSGQSLDRWRPLVAPVMNGSTEPVYWSELILRPGFTPLSWDDLEGVRIAYNETESFSGWAVMRIALSDHDVGFERVNWIETGSHTASMSMVESGQADIAAIYSMVLMLEGWNHDVMERLGPWPAPPISLGVASALTAQELISMLEDMHNDPKGRSILASSQVTRLAAVDPSDYREMAEMVAARLDG